MFAIPLSWDSEYTWIIETKLERFYREHLNRDLPIWLRWVIPKLIPTTHVVSSVAFIALIAGLDEKGLVALILSFFVSTFFHELGHYIEMVKVGIIPERVGLGLWFGPFEHLQIKFDIKITLRDEDGNVVFDEYGKKVKVQRQLWIQPMTFMLVAYVSEGEEGMFQIQRRPAPIRARIFGRGVVHNIVLALLAWSVYVYWEKGIQVDALMIAFGFASAVLLAYWMTSRLGWSPSKLNFVVVTLALASTALLIIRRDLEDVPTWLWVGMSVTLAVFVLAYKQVVTYRILPLAGLVISAWLLWLIVPDLAADFAYASAHGGAGEGEYATLLGPRSLFELYGLADGEASPRIAELLGADLTRDFLFFGQRWSFVPLMTAMVSLGLGLANLLPFISADGGFLWQNMLNPDGSLRVSIVVDGTHLRRHVSKPSRARKFLGDWGPRVTTASLAPLFLTILVRTELGDWLSLGILVIVIFIVLYRLVKARNSRARQKLYFRKALNPASLDPVARI